MKIYSKTIIFKLLEDNGVMDFRDYNLVHQKWSGKIIIILI